MPGPAPEVRSARLVVPASHPCLPGHFPGNPVVPGVVLLDAVLEAVRAAGWGPATRLLRAKFTAPVRPEEAVTIRLERRAAGRVAFACERGGAAVLAGELAA